MAIQGLKKLPPVVTVEEALHLYQKVARIKSLIGQLNAELSHSIVNRNILQVLSLSESVQSTRIEGTQVTFADIIEQSATKNKSAEVIEVQNYQKALQYGIEQIEMGFPITSRLIRDLHRILMDNEARGTTSASGEFRKIQNFLGPDNNIENAVYLPIPANEVPDYMTNLEYYINNESHFSFEKKVNEGHISINYDEDPLIKTAVIHAQFESIHPFLDGNGRLGRILIVLYCMADKLIDYPVFFISEELEAERLRYYNRLNEVRGDSPDWYSWIDFFLTASQNMAESLLKKLNSVERLAQDGLLQIDNQPHMMANVWLYTFSTLACTAKDVSKSLEITPQTARKHLNTLADLKLIEKDNSKSRNQMYVNYDLLRILR